MFEQRINKGMNMLTHDEIMTINCAQLNMTSIFDCVLGQLNGFTHWNEMHKRGWTTRDAFAMGFMLLDNMSDKAQEARYARLTCEWQTAIAAYRMRYALIEVFDLDKARIL